MAIVIDRFRASVLLRKGKLKLPRISEHGVEMPPAFKLPPSGVIDKRISRTMHSGNEHYIAVDTATGTERLVPV